MTSSRPIRVLSDALVDQIAAGEVVERPASVIKELLENAIDAGAGSVAVEVEAGGAERIRVTDDGSGMSPEGAALCIRRHATSKIADASDLEAIGTLGFRGEALPSIASVSRFVLTTRERSSVAATRVRVDGGGEAEVAEVGAAPGTTVEVSDLFHNVPARRKFLKSRATESAHCTEACLRVALSRPALRLTLVRGGRRREYLPAANRTERVRSVLADEALREIRSERDGVGLHAVLSAPEHTRSGASGLHIFVNGRPVRDRGLARAVAFAYGSVLPPGRFPVGAVYIDVEATEVDVNVHPQKSEVRFARGRAVPDSVTRMLAASLGTVAWSGWRAGAAAAGPAARGDAYWDARLGGGSDASAGPGPDGGSGGTGDDAVDRWGIAEALRESDAPYADSGDADAWGEPERAVTAKGPFGRMRVLAQVRRMLVVCEGDDALHVLDQHAADERVRYHRLVTAHRAGSVATQRLLFPARVEVSEADVASLREHADLVARVGLECAMVGPTTVAVHAVPSLVQRAAPERLLRDLLDEIGRTGERSFGDAVDTRAVYESPPLRSGARPPVDPLPTERINRLLATMACHGAIRAGDELSVEECSALLRSLDEVGELAGHCPHGRPVVYSVPFTEIERRLGR